MGTVAKAAGGLLLVALVGSGAFVLALEYPATRGPVRCWLQEQVYAPTWEAAPQGTPVIEAVRVTDPVRDMCDAADDPAIYAHEGTFLMLGTNKQRSLNVYGADGGLISRSDDLGAPNNVDVRTGFGRVLALASDKDGSQIEGFALRPTSGALRPLPGSPFAARSEEEVYGLCLYRAGERLYAFTTDKSGLIVQYRIEQDGEAFAAREVRALGVASQAEGCVVDDANGALFVGEEDVGIWRFDAAQSGSAQGTLIAQTGADGALSADVEGLALYLGASPDEGFLIASSQGDNTYAVFDRVAPHAFRGRFQVRFEGTLIGDTDGLDVMSAALGPEFPKGLLVIQDGFVRTGGRKGAQELTGERRQQGFAYVSWADIERALGL